jgi:hypothetical protein
MISILLLMSSLAANESGLSAVNRNSDQSKNSYELNPVQGLKSSVSAAGVAKAT